ncbi:endonuclease/exonuclease/phosphatase family protein [Streptomyces virginiae]|uniref:endonuclease/exonuclease/phosphatase family protein n=1 Tax=Streptomyces virginiae TaxID=1961 RepID=UPI0036ED0BD0
MERGEPLPPPRPRQPPSGRCAAKDRAAYEAKLEGLAATVGHLAPDLLGVQEVGAPEALADLVERLDGEWHTALSKHADRRGIRVGFLSRRPLTVTEDRTAFPEHLPRVQVEDDGTTIRRMGRGALAVRWSPAAGQSVDVVVCHLKSKLLTFPGNRHSTDDEELRARYAAYALYRRAAEAVTLRAMADRLLQGDGAAHEVIVMGGPQRRVRGRHHADPVRAARLPDRHRGLQGHRPRGPETAVEPRSAHP